MNLIKVSCFLGIILSSVSVADPVKQTKQIKTETGNIILLKIEDMGEPAGEPYHITANIKCSGKVLQILNRNSCKYKSYTYAKGVLTVHFLNGEMNEEGEVVCRVPVSDRAKVPQGCKP